jgi:hypothetical protein
VTDLTGLQAHLTSMGASVVLAQTDTALPAPLTAFLATVPTGTVTLAPGPGGIALAGSTLTISGATSATWPVSGLTGTSVSLTGITVTVTDTTAADGTVATTVTGSAAGSLPVGGTSAGVALTSAVTPGASGPVPCWNLTLATSATLTATSLVTLGLGGLGQAVPVPSGLTALDTAVAVAPGSLLLVFYPGTSYAPSLRFTLTVPGATWSPAPPVLAFTGIDIVAVIAPGSYQATLIGHLTIGGTPMDVGAGMRPATMWTAFVRPTGGGAFPGLAALAAWVGGTSLSTETTGGLQAIPVGSSGFDAAIASVTAGFDWSTAALSYLDVLSLITLGALQLDVRLRLPDVLLTGSLHDGAPVTVAALLTSLSLPSAGVPVDLSITEASFSATPLRSMFTADLTIDNVWAIGPLSIEEVSVGVVYNAVDGLSGSVEGVLTLGASISVDLLAAYVDTATGWQFTGATLPGSVLAVGDLITTLASSFGITTVPAVLSTLSLTGVTASYATGTGAFMFGAEADFTVLGAAASLVVNAAVTDTADAPSGEATTTGTAGYSATYSGKLTIGALTFSLTFNVGAVGADVVLTGAWQAPAGNPYLGFADIASALGLPDPQVPDGLDLRLTAATLSYDVTKSQLVIAAQSATYGSAVFIATPVTPAGGGAAATQFFATLAVGHDIALSDLPLLGEALADADTCAVQDLQVIVSSADVDAATVNPLVPPGYPAFPAQGTTSPVALSATLRFGTETFPITLGTPAQPTATAPATQVGAAQGGTGGAGVVAVPPAQSDGTAWFTVQKAFGPITFQRVGVRYADNTLRFSLDASLTVGGLAVTLQGASVGSPITSFSPQFSLRGLGIAYSSPPLAIGGGFASVEPTGGATFQYDGAVVVSMPAWGLTAYGSYAELDGEPSMFVFLQVNGTFGGPPAFFVIGLAGGFGYNSSVRVPAPDQVITFPLVGGLTNPAALGGATATPMQALAALTGGADPWITHALGQNWLAAGVRFSTFQLLDSTALLVVEFGNELTIVLLGISTARFPAAAAQQAYAQIQLQLRALLRPSDGFFSLTANLTSNSFLIDPACVLTGGFAFCVWFSPSPNAGDFVVVLGGYHPNFTPPAYYPAVAPLGFSWSLDSVVSISGTAYFALTPSAIMVGGALNVRYHDGNLRAWFTAHADIVVTWDPFSFLAPIGVGIGVDYTVNLLFTTKTLHLEAGADLLLWGPPTGGEANVRLWVVSFTISFGASQVPPPQALSWPEFQALLPAAGSSTTFTATAGLAVQQTDNATLAAATPVITTGAAAPAPWLVRSEGFSFTMRSAMPSSKLILGDATTAFATGAAINIRPMQQAGLTVTTQVTVSLTSGASPVTVDLSAAGWTVTALTASVPKALWGTGVLGTLDPGNDQLVTGQLTGLTVQAPVPMPGGWATGQVPVASTIGFDPLPPGPLPVQAGAGPAGDVPTAGQATVAVIASQLATTAAAARDQLYQALTAVGAAPATNGPLTGLAAQAGALFADEPLLVAAS